MNPIPERPENAVAPKTRSKLTGAKPASHTPPRSTRPTKTRARSPNKAPGARAGSKTAKILSLLQRPGGASLPELRKATD